MNSSEETETAGSVHSCWNSSRLTEEGGSTPAADKFYVSSECALFDFIVYTVAMGSLCVVGLAGNTAACYVLHSERARTSTSFLLQVRSTIGATYAAYNHVGIVDNSAVN